MAATGFDKDVEGVILDYLPSDIRDYDGSEFDLRVSFGDDPLGYAFWITVPGADEELTLRQLFSKHVLGESKEDRERIRGSLDTETNPDLPELLLAIRRAFDDVQKGRAVMRLCVNKGPCDIQLDEPASRHFSRAYSQAHGFDYRLIDIVLDVTDIPASSIPPDQQDEMKRQFRLLLLLYMMDRYGQDVVFEGRNFDAAGIEAVADWAVNQGLLDLSTKEVKGEYRGVYVRTAEGNTLVRNVVRETDDLINNYDHFADVTVDEPPEFGTGRGDDVRVPVYRAEGVDAVRAAFLMNLENGHYERTWRDTFGDDAFFRELLAIAAAPNPVSDQKLERIVRAGKAWAARNRDTTRRSDRANRLWRDAEDD